MAQVFEKPAREMTCTVGKDPLMHDFITIQSAVDYAAEMNLSCTMYVSAGTYRENVKVYHDHLTIICETDTVLQSDLAANQLLDGMPRGTFQTATLFINGSDIVIEGLTIENTAGPGNQVGQAVAVYLEGTDIYFVDCRLTAYQDTLCLGPLPQYTKEGTPMISPWCQKIYLQQRRYFKACEISGTVDFIFGGGDAHFDSCYLHCKNTEQNNYITAAATSPEAKGYIFEHCRVTGEKKYSLGRPWRVPAKVCFFACHFDDALDVAGWSDWGKTRQRKQICFAEHVCTYTKQQQRASWIDMKGMKVQ